MAEILIVDDERVLREGLKAMLAGEGFAVRTARDGEDALKKLSEKDDDSDKMLKIKESLLSLRTKLLKIRDTL